MPSPVAIQRPSKLSPLSLPWFECQQCFHTGLAPTPSKGPNIENESSSARSSSARSFFHPPGVMDICAFRVMDVRTQKCFSQVSRACAKVFPRDIRPNDPGKSAGNLAPENSLFGLFFPSWKQTPNNAEESSASRDLLTSSMLWGTCQQFLRDIYHEGRACKGEEVNLPTLLHICVAGLGMRPATMRIQFWLPPPAPEFLSKDFCLHPGLKWKFLLRRIWLGQKLLPLQFPELSLPY